MKDSQEASPLPEQSNRARSLRRASLDTPSGFLPLSSFVPNQLTQAPLQSSSSPSAQLYRSQPNTIATSPIPTNLKRSNSQPSLHQLPRPDPTSLHPSNHLHPSTPQQNTPELMDQDDQNLAITRFPRRCSPKIVNRHKRTVSVASSISSAVAYQHQPLMLNRHQLDLDEEGDAIEIEGGMSGLFRRADEEENQMLDGPLDERRASESCGSSAVGEPMGIDSEPPSKPSSYVGAKKVRRKPVNRANLLVSQPTPCCLPTFSYNTSMYIYILQIRVTHLVTRSHYATFDDTVVPNGKPRPRAHLRVAAQLSTEEVSPDLLTEAEVHRRFKSIPFVLPQPSSSTPTNTLPFSTPSNSPLIPRTPSSPFYHQPHRPTPNRFPEQVDDDGEDNRLEAQSSSSDDEPVEDHQSHCSGLRHSIISQDEESEDQKTMEIQKWKMFRGSGSSGSCGPLEINRAGKRRCQDSERYEAGMFKRRAVSPSSTSLSSCIGSPILNPVSIPHPSLTTTTASSSTPTPIPLSIHQPITVNSSSSSSVCSMGFRGSLSVHQQIINNKNPLSTPDRDDLPTSNRSSSS